MRASHSLASAASCALPYLHISHFQYYDLAFFLGGVQPEGDQGAHLRVKPTRHAALMSSLTI